MEKAYNIKLSLRRSSFDRKRITSPELAAEYARGLYHSDIEIYESVWGLFLNRCNEVIGFMRISQGGTSASIIDRRMIYKAAIDLLADGFILVHNHPSGSLKPSQMDIEQTGKLKDGLEMLDIRLVDHIILAEGGYYSFNDN